MMKLFLRTRASGEVQCVRHRVSGHRSQQFIYNWIQWVMCFIQRLSQRFVRPVKKTLTLKKIMLSLILIAYS